MTHYVFELLGTYLARYGYWTVAVALLLENAGLPVPGETILLLASAMAASHHLLHLPYIVLVGTCAAALGDNIGFAVGVYGGRNMLVRYGRIFRVSNEAIEKAETLLQRHGALLIFAGRFIFGVRIIAGPLAGVLRMPWKNFAIANLAGAAVWVTTISTVGYLFGRNWDLLLANVRRANFLLLTAAIALVVIFWWRRHRAKHSNLTE